MTFAPEASSASGILAAQDRYPWLDTPLAPNRSCIRILSLHKGTSNMPVSCDLKVVDLDDNPNYEVLSYVWGDQNDTRPMTVGGVAFHATKNLFDFLHCLRLGTAERYIWADAICIDQSNDEEKSHQITLMTKVYQQATEAHIWFGPFNDKSWYRDMAKDKEYVLACEFSPNIWKQFEEVFATDLQYFVRQEGFKPLPQNEYESFERRFGDNMLQETLAVLDLMASGGHLYTYPVYTVIDKPGGGHRYGMIRTWPWLLDCIRWLLLRPWWTRVWTLQEAVLPRVDPVVHAPPHTFKLSRLLNGVKSMLNHNGKSCCKWFGQVVLTQYRDHEGDQWTQALAVANQRKTLASLNEQGHEGMGVPLYLVINAIQGRRATEIRDHWFGVFGILQVQWQEESRLFPAYCTTAELFNQFSKLLYSESLDLTQLDLARRLRQSKIIELPSWSIDLSAPRSSNEEDSHRWTLYDATPGTTFNAITEWWDLRASELSVKVRHIGTVHVCSGHIPADSSSQDINTSTVRSFVKQWLEIYRDTVGRTNEDPFWRAVFMDRNVQQHWMHRRVRPLGPPRLNDIKRWWTAWNRTNNHRDPDVDRKAGGVFHGSFHYRALKLNVNRRTFFITTGGTPGMGPHDIRPGDEVYALEGCKALAVLRKALSNGVDCFTFVGLGFVEGWMYGKATQNKLVWETLQLH